MRELERLIERGVALAELDRIDLEDLPPHIRGDYGRIVVPAAVNTDSMRAWGSRYARLVFERCAHNKRRTCRILGISYHTLDAYLRYTERTRPGGRTKMPAWVKKSNPVADAV